jgi:hypothetical protein
VLQRWIAAAQGGLWGNRLAAEVSKDRVEGLAFQRAYRRLLEAANLVVQASFTKATHAAIVSW